MFPKSLLGIGPCRVLGVHCWAKSNLIPLWGRQTPLHLPSYKHAVPRKCTEGALTYSRHQGLRR